MFLILISFAILIKTENEKDILKTIRIMQNFTVCTYKKINGVMFIQ